MTDADPRQQFDFEQIDADAVCEQCGTVHPEPTLMCKACGNNLREQRQRRIAGEQGAELPGEGVSRVRVFTTVLTALGIFVILAAVIFIGDIEAWLVNAQVAEDTTGTGNVWTGPGSEIYSQLANELAQNPITRAEESDAIENPVIDTAYNGRYVLVRPDPLSGQETIGQALLSRRGDRIYFVAQFGRRGIEVRGFARLQENENGEIRPVAMNSASVNIGGSKYLAWGYAVRNPNGSHTVYGQSAYDSTSHGILAYRVR